MTSYSRSGTLSSETCHASALAGGKVLVVASMEERGLRRLTMIASDTGEMLGRPVANDAAPQLLDAAFSPDGKLCATCSTDGAIRIWNPSTKGSIATFLPTRSVDQDLNRLPFRRFGFSPDGRRLIDFTYRHVRLLDASTGKALGKEWVCSKSLDQAAGHVESDVSDFYRFSPAGHYLWLSGIYEDPARSAMARSLLIDHETGKETQMQIPSTGPVAFSPDGRRMVAADQTEASAERREHPALIWDVEKAEPIGAPLSHLGRVTASVFYPDGRTVITGDEQGQVKVWDSESGMRRGPPLGHSIQEPMIEPGPDGKARITGMNTIPVTIEAIDVCVDPDVVLITVGPRDANLHELSGREWRQVCAWGLGNLFHPPASPARDRFGPDTELAPAPQPSPRMTSPDGRWSLNHGVRPKIRVVNAASGDEVRELALDAKDEPAGVELGSTGEVVLVPANSRKLAGSASQDLTESEKSATGAGESVFRAPKGSGLFVVGGGVNQGGGAPRDLDLGTGFAKIHRSTSGEPVGDPIPHPGRVEHVVFSADGKRMVLGSSDGLIRAWDIDPRAPLGPVFALEGDLVEMILSPDGKSLLVREKESLTVARRWDLASGQPIGSMLDRFGEVLAIRYDRSGNPILAARVYESIEITDLATGSSVGREVPLPVTYIRSLPGMDARPQATLCLAFSPDGAALLTVSNTFWAQFWDVHTGKPIGSTIKGVYDARFTAERLLFVRRHFGGETALQLINPKDGRPLTDRITTHKNPWIRTISRNGRRALVAPTDDTIQIWDVAEGRPLGEPLLLPHRLDYSSFSRDGEYLFTITSGNVGQIWQSNLGLPLGRPFAASRIEPGPLVPSPVGGSIDRILAWVQADTGLGISMEPSIRVRRLSPAEIADARSRLEKSGGPPAEPVEVPPRSGDGLHSSPTSLRPTRSGPPSPRVSGPAPNSPGPSKPLHP